jgi:hypothetical protein
MHERTSWRVCQHNDAHHANRIHYPCMIGVHTATLLAVLLPLASMGAGALADMELALSELFVRVISESLAGCLRTCACHVVGVCACLTDISRRCVKGVAM